MRVELAVFLAFLGYDLGLLTAVIMEKKRNRREGRKTDVEN